jgi:uncharacterized protein (DUF1684 family)
MPHIRSSFLIIVGLFVFLLQTFAQNDWHQQIIDYRSKYYTSYIDGARHIYQAEDTLYLDFYTPDENFRVRATYLPFHQLKDTTIWTYSGLERAYVIRGVLQFELLGQKFEILGLQARQFLQHPVYKYQLFVPFKDLSTGEHTYGGGRYLEIHLQDMEKEQEFILDFNLAYNPLCAYSDGFNCPIPPEENFIDIEISAGEKNFKKEK